MTSVDYAGDLAYLEYMVTAALEPTHPRLLSNSAAVAEFMKKCDNCKSGEAEIFQVNGDYCLQCWQELTHTVTS
jgi:hypothetical protein